MRSIMKLNWILVLLVAMSTILTSCDQCEGINCSNGGKCEKGECECPDGFSGDRCELEDKCLTGAVNCQNDGVCVDGKCDCPEGYEGADCSDVDLCIINDIKV